MTDPRCAHCLIDHRGEQRYAALPGWHDWKPDRTEAPRPVHVQINMQAPRPEPTPMAHPYYRALYERWIRA